MQWALLRWSDDILRRATWTTSSQTGQRTLTKLVCSLVACGLFYGAAMGSFGLAERGDEWLLQMVYSAVKLPLLLGVSFAISLPSFFVLNTLFGLRPDFSVVLRSLLATQAGFTIFLAAFAPLTLFWYASSPDYARALLFNGCMFAAASIASQRLLRGHYRSLIERNPRHSRMLWAWTGVYALVAIQMAWLLRPFIGAPDRPITFFRPEAWENAYLVIWRLITQVL